MTEDQAFRPDPLLRPDIQARSHSVPRRGAPHRSNPLWAFLALLGAGLASAPYARAQEVPTAVILPNGYTQFLDMNGKPLADGTVTFYQPGTTTPKTTWQDPYQTIANPTIVTLNAAGEALIWGTGIYRQIVKDVNGNLIWDQLTGGYNCTGGGAIPGGAPGALQYNNMGVFGGLALGNSSQVLIGNASGPPTWGNVPDAALGASTGTGPIVRQNGATLNNPTLNNPTLNGGVWHNPTFDGTITGLPGGSTSSCTNTTGTAKAHCIGSDLIFNIESTADPLPGGTGHALVAFMSGQVAAWDVFTGAGPAATAAEREAAQLAVQEQVVTARKNINSIPALTAHVQQIADYLGLKLK